VTAFERVQGNAIYTPSESAAREGRPVTIPKPPTPQGISALLGKAGFAAAGIYLDDEGYRATWADGSLTSVCVRFHAAGDGSSRGLLALPALVLTAYGYSAEIAGTRLIVTAGKD
jgi:hypothetical protein